MVIGVNSLLSGLTLYSLEPVPKHSNIREFFCLKKEHFN